MITNIIILMLEVMLLGVVVLTLHRISPRYGLTPLLAFALTLTVFLQTADTSLIYIKISPSLYIFFAASACIPVILLAVLILYIMEGTVVARLTIFSILGASILYYLLFWRANSHLSMPGGGSFLNLTPNSPSLTLYFPSILASSIAFVGDLFIIAIVYQGIKNNAPRVPIWVAPGIALLVSLWSDTVLYQGLCCGLPPSSFFMDILDDLLGKTLIGIVLWPLIAVYLGFITPNVPGFRNVEKRPTFDLLFGPFRSIEVALARSEASLYESKELYQSLVEVMPMSVCRKDLEGRLTFVNQRYCDEVGFSASEMRGKTDFDLYPKELAEKYRQNDIAVITSGKVIEVVEEHQPFNRERGYVQSIKAPIHNSQGQVIGVQVVFWDITERMQTEAEREKLISELEIKTTNLQERQHFIEAILDAEPGTVYIYDLQKSTNVFINRDWLINYGYTEDETQGDENLLSKVIHPEDLPRVIAHHDQLRNTSDEKNIRELEYRIRKKNGEWRWVQSRDKVFTLNAKGEVTQILGILHDITESKQAQDALRESERKYRLLFENMTSGFAVHKMIYDEKGKPFDYLYLEVNPAFEKLTGVLASALLGKTIKEVMPETENYWIETFGRVAQTGEPIAYTNFARELDRHYETYVFSPEKGLFAVVFNDATEKIKAQEEIRALNDALKQRISELEASNTELTQFTYTVSHDLKSPLVTINGYIGYIEEDALSGNMERLKKDTQRIQEATNKMHALLTELLELSRIGRMLNTPENIPFGDLIKDALGIVHGQLEANHVTVRILSPQGAQPNLPAVQGDRQRLTEVLQNLIDNAAKYMGNQANPLIEIGQQGDEEGKPVFFVRDNGIGIAPKYHERVFGLFNKLDSKSEGTGIGLALVKKIIEFHGGRIWVESETGKGATFYFTLPRG